MGDQFHHSNDFFRNRTHLVVLTVSRIVGIGVSRNQILPIDGVIAWDKKGPLILLPPLHSSLTSASFEDHSFTIIEAPPPEYINTLMFTRIVETVDSHGKQHIVEVNEKILRFIRIFMLSGREEISQTPLESHHQYNSVVKHTRKLTFRYGLKMDFEPIPKSANPFKFFPKINYVIYDGNDLKLFRLNRKGVPITSPFNVKTNSKAGFEILKNFICVVCPPRAHPDDESSFLIEFHEMTNFFPVAINDLEADWEFWYNIHPGWKPSYFFENYNDDQGKNQENFVSYRS